MSDSKQGIFKVMLLAFVVLQSDVRASVISIVTVWRQAMTSRVTVDTRRPTSGGVLVYNSCNKARTKTTARPTASIDHRHRHARAHVRTIT